MNTAEFIDKFFELLKKLGFECPREYKIDELESSVRVFFEKNQEEFFNSGLNFVPKSDALKKIWNRYYLESSSRGDDLWNSKYVREKYSHVVDGCYFIYYPAKNPKRLIVNFSSMGKDRYDRYSRYWDPKEVWDGEEAFIFFKDDTYRYYLGSEDDPKYGVYFRIIRDFIGVYSLKSEHVYAVGGSMGGYAAIYYALSLDLGGAVVAAPQIDRQSMIAHKYANWTKHSNQCGNNWKDLNYFAYAFEKLPYLYIEYGNYSSDVIAAEGIIKVYKEKKSLCISRKASWDEHTVTDVLSKDLVSSVVDFFESNRKIDSIY